MWPLILPALVKLLLPCIHMDTHTYTHKAHICLLFICIPCLCVMLACFVQVSMYLELFSSFLYLSVYAARTIWFGFVVASPFLFVLCMINIHTSMPLSTFSCTDLVFPIHFPNLSPNNIFTSPFYYSYCGAANV